MLKKQLLITILLVPLLFVAKTNSKKSCCKPKNVSSLCVSNNLSVGQNLNVGQNLTVCGTLTAAGQQIFNGIRSYGEFYNYVTILPADAPQPLGTPIPWRLADNSSGANSLNSANFSLDSTTGIITIANPGIYLLTFGTRFKYDAATSVGPAQGEALVVLNGQPLPSRITTGEVNLSGLITGEISPFVIYSEPVNSFLIQTTAANSQVTINVTLENNGVQFSSPAHTFHSNAFLSIVQLN